MQTKPKGVTTQMKALGEYILMVLFVLLLKRVHFAVNETQALAEYCSLFLFNLGNIYRD